MMKKLEYLLLAAVMCVFAGCEQDAIDELHKDIDEQGDRLSVVEAWLRQTNSNIAALQELIQAKQQGKTIVKVIPTGEGYTIKLSDGTELVIRHGTEMWQCLFSECGILRTGIIIGRLMVFCLEMPMAKR